jgi:hypothetical protein
MEKVLANLRVLWQFSSQIALRTTVAQMPDFDECTLTNISEHESVLLRASLSEPFLH